jgi:hypothetical protein
MRVELATEADDAALRALLAGMPMPGAVRVAFGREPSYFGALGVVGRRHLVVVARDPATGALAGFGVASVREGYVNGAPAPVGFLGGLRLLPEYRGGSLVARGYRFFRERAPDLGAALFLTTVMEENRAALALLASGRAGLPRYRDAGRFRCLLAGTRQRLCAPPPPGVSLAAATPADRPALLGFLRREGPRRQFFPVYDEPDLAGGGLLRGLAPGGLLLARRGRDLVGCLGAWDQSSFRQVRLRGYAPWLAALRPALNLLAVPFGAPLLPPPGAELAHAVLALPCVRDDDPAVFRALLAAQLDRLRDRVPNLLAGLHERDPLAPELGRLRHVPYASRLFVVHWPEHATAFDRLDGRVPYLEAGSL